MRRFLPAPGAPVQGVTGVTASWKDCSYLQNIEFSEQENEMTKFYSLIAAAILFMPVAYVTMMQAAQMVV